MCWLSGPSQFTLTLMRYDGDTIVGYSDWGPLFCNAHRRATLGSALSPYNSIRQPGHEFTYVVDMSGNKLPLSTRIVEDMTIVIP
jgi:hypothetical protein